MERTMFLVLDGIGCGLFASHLDWSCRAVDAIVDDAGPGPAVIWGWDQRTSPTMAALLNGTFIQGSELDDYHPAAVHAAACVLPSVFSAAKLVPQLTGAEACLAIVAGYETGPRIARAMGGMDLLKLGWHCTSIYGAIASAVAASRALGLNESQTEDALGTAATQACGLMSAQFEAMVKRMHSGFAARAGLTSALLARNGFTGIRAVLERDYGGFASTFTNGKFDLSEISDELGQTWKVMEIAVKPTYGCLGALHTSIETVCELQRREQFGAEDVSSVRIGLPAPAFEHAGWRLERPATVVGAQLNMAYAVAITLLDGEPSVRQFAPGRINADDVWNLMDVVSCYPNAELDQLGDDAAFSCDVELTLRSGRKFQARLIHPRGHPARPHSNDEIVAKFRRVTDSVIDERRQEEIIELVLDLPNAPDINRLLNALTARPPPSRGVVTLARSRPPCSRYTDQAPGGRARARTRCP
jgi:2-methylcitrate dehydratase PrpD